MTIFKIFFIIIPIYCYNNFGFTELKNYIYFKDKQCLIPSISSQIKNKILIIQYFAKSKLFMLSLFNFIKELISQIFQITLTVILNLLFQKLLIEILLSNQYTKNILKKNKFYFEIFNKTFSSVLSIIISQKIFKVINKEVITFNIIQQILFEYELSLKSFQKKIIKVTLKKGIVKITRLKIQDIIEFLGIMNIQKGKSPIINTKKNKNLVRISPRKKSSKAEGNKRIIRLANSKNKFFCTPQKIAYEGVSVHPFREITNIK